MPRTARIEYPKLLQHVIVRGIEKRDIFRDDDDRRLSEGGAGGRGTFLRN